MKKEEVKIIAQPLPTEIINGTAPFSDFCAYLNACNVRSVTLKDRIALRNLLNHLCKYGESEIQQRYNYRRQMMRVGKYYHNF